MVAYNEQHPVDKQVYMENAAQLVDADRLSPESVVAIGLDRGKDGQNSVSVRFVYGDESSLCSSNDIVFEEMATAVNIVFAKELQKTLAEKFGIKADGEIKQGLDEVFRNAEGLKSVTEVGRLMHELEI